MDLDYELYAPSYRLPCVSKRVTFCMGHIINDLSSTIYYNFILLYLVNVAELEIAHAGYIFLFGQVVTALTSITADHVGQHRNAFCCCYTRRKSWHLIGAVLSALGFIFLFMPCIGCFKLNSMYKSIYYGSFILFFQLGWSFVQSAHLRLIPEITRNQHERIELNAIRYTVGIVGKLTAFTLLWLLLSLTKSTVIDVEDRNYFRTMAIVVIAVGLVTAAVFHIGTDETGYDLFLETHMAVGSYGRMTKKQWFKEPQFYQMLFLYLFTRISANVAVLYLPLYISQTLSLHKTYTVVYPMAAFLGSAFVPFLTRPLSRCSSPKTTYTLGAILVGGTAVWAWFLKMSWPVYELQTFAFVIILGAGGSITTVSSLTMTHHLIGDNTESGGIVLSMMSLLEKVLIGVAVLVINQLNTCSLGTACEMQYYRYVFTGVVGGAALVGLLVLITVACVKLGQLRYSGVLVSATAPSKGPEDGQESHAHMDVFEKTANEDCFNYWSCLSTTREPEAHNVAVIYSCPHTLNRLQASLESSSINSGPYDVPGMPRSHSYESLNLGSPTINPTVLHTSSSAPNMIEYSGNFEKHHKRKNKPRKPLSSKDTAGLVDNEQLPEPTEGLPSPGPPAVTNGLAAEPINGKDAAGTSTQVDIHPVPKDVYAETNGNSTPEERGSPYDNVPITVTPGGKIIDNEANV